MLSSRLIAAAVFAAPLATAQLYDKIISLTDGDVIGYQAFTTSPINYTWSNWQDITVFKGIPYGADTSGINRWQPPQPPPKWTQPFHAKDFGPACPSATRGVEYGYIISEDCLSINVWTAARDASARLPVVMWSSPAFSSSGDGLYDGGAMAQKGVVFVSYNHRAGAFGWLATDELSKERQATIGRDVSGNWAMLDQIAALKWIRNNIEHFGGDRNRITVMGNSQGAAATYQILNSQLTQGDIAGAIIQSGVRDPRDPFYDVGASGYETLADNLEVGRKFLGYFNITTMAEARQLAMDDIVNVATTVEGGGGPLHFKATLDYYVIPTTYWNTLEKGIANQVPVMTGNAHDENGGNYTIQITQEEYEAFLLKTYNTTWVDRFREAYPATTAEEAAKVYNDQFRDRSDIGLYFWSQLWKAHSSAPIYTYHWTHPPPGVGRGSYHESEINYVLNNLYATDLPWQTEDYEIAEKMVRYWVNFIKKGDPNDDGLIRWPAVTSIAGDRKVQGLGDSFGQEKIGEDDKIDLFAEWFSGLKRY